MRLTLVHNPSAGDGSHRGKRLVKLLEEAGHDVTRWSTKRPIEEAFEDPGDAVVAAGGDGTVKRCAVRLAGTRVPLVVLALGNANNIAKSLALLAPLAEIADGMEEHPRERIDVGSVAVGGRRMPFVESVGGGLVTSLMAAGSRRIEESRDQPGNEIDRALMVLRDVLKSQEAQPWEVELDGKDRSGRYLAVEAMNMGMVGPNLALAPRADPGDGLFDVVLVPAAARRRLIAHVEERLAGRGAPPRLTVVRARRVRLVAPARSLHVDDEAIENDDDVEVRLTLKRGALTILRPRAAV